VELLPTSAVVWVLVFVALGEPQTLVANAQATTVEGAKQVIALYPTASQEAIKQLGTNGGGFYNSNSAVPFENPNGFTNMLEDIAILLIPMAQVFMFGRMIGRMRQAWAVWSAMFVLMAVHAPASRFWSLAPALIWFLFLLVLPSAIEWVRPHVSDAYYREALSDVQTHFGAAYYGYAAIGLAVTAVLMLDWRWSLSVKLVGTGALVVAGLSLFLVPIGAAIQQEPIKQAAQLARSRGWEVIMWRLNAPSFSVYYGRPTLSREPKAGDLIITKAKRLQELAGLRPEIVYARNGIVLVRVY